MASTPRFHYPLRLSSRMLPTDALFWYVEHATPELRPLVAALVMLDRRPDPDRLRASVERWVARLPRLRQRVVETPLKLGLPEWEDDPHFELDYHAREVILPAPSTKRHLLDFAGAVFATPLDPLRPLWEAYLIEGLEDNRAACFFKVHHAVMDGVGSLAVFDALTQAHRAEPVRVPRSEPPRPPSPASFRLGRLVRDAIGNTAAGLRAAAGIPVHAALNPLETLGQLRSSLRGIRGLMADLTAEGIADPLARDSTGIGRRLDGMTLSMPRLSNLAQELDATLNDLVLAVVSGAVGRYHDHRHVHVDTLHCMVPMNLRGSDERSALGNRVGAFTVALPVGEPDPLLRLARIQEQTRAAKSDRRGAAYPLVTQALALMPGFAYRALAQTIAGRINLICTNIPRPPAPRYLAGAKIDVIYPFAPVAVGTPLSIALLSHGDAYGVGIDTDPAAIPDPEVLTRYLAAALTELEDRARPRGRRSPTKQRRQVPVMRQPRARAIARARA